MIKHIVMWDVQGTTQVEKEANLRILKSAFESLRGQIPGLVRLDVGIDFSRIDYARDVVLYTEFTSREALAAYAVHPEHLRVKDALGAMRVVRHQVDYETEE